MTRVLLATLLTAASLTAGHSGQATPAAAPTAVETVWAFGASVVENPVGVTALPPQFRGNSLCPEKDATVQRTSVGVYVVTFPCVGSVNGIVHVTAIGYARVCNPARWVRSGTNEVVTIRCYGTNGVPVAAYPVDALFSVLYTTSDGVGVTSGGWYDYVFAAADGSPVTSYNSTGAANSVVHTGVGTYRVTVVNRGTVKLSGNVHLNAVNTTTAARECQVGAWFPGDAVNQFTVACYDFDGRPFDSPFVLAYHNERALTGAPAAPSLFGYVWTKAGGPPQVSFNSAGAPNTVDFSTVDFAQIGGAATHVQVGAFGPNPMSCGPVQLWEGGTHEIVVKDIICWSPPKWPVQPFFLVTANGDL